MSKSYHQKLEEAGHKLRRHDGEVDIFVLNYGFHNGPGCIKCGDEWCHHCKGPIVPCIGSNRKESAMTQRTNKGIDPPTQAYLVKTSIMLSVYADTMVDAVSSIAAEEIAREKLRVIGEQYASQLSRSYHLGEVDVKYAGLKVLQVYDEGHLRVITKMASQPKRTVV